jgi:5'-3' exonuclease
MLFFSVSSSNVVLTSLNQIPFRTTISFVLGKPVQPFEQLLAVLPSFSKALLPAVFHPLMLEKASPLHVYYPEISEIVVDMEYSSTPWEGVVKLPFIDVLLLLEECRKVYKLDLLTNDGSLFYFYFIFSLFVRIESEQV